ncbi:MAG: nucleotide exchange factor GrpE [Ardenticatenaceae bacterium]
MRQIEPEFVVDEQPKRLLLEGTVRDVPIRVVRDLMDQRAELAHQQKQVAQQQKLKTRKLLRDLLGVLDAFDGIWRDVEPNQLDEMAKNLITGFETTKMQLKNVLDLQDVTPMETLPGSRFDPQSQEVVGLQAQPNMPDGIVLQVVQKGYQWETQILRRAKVIVSKRSR